MAEDRVLVNKTFDFHLPHGASPEVWIAELQRVSEAAIDAGYISREGEITVHTAEYCCDVTGYVTYWRPETLQETAGRLAEKAASDAARDERDRTEYERLKKKFG